MDHSELIAQIPALRRYARALTGNAWAADDLVQDTLERACTKWRLWAAGSDLRAWLFTLMHNLFVNQLRHSNRQAGLATPLDIDALPEQLAAPDAGQEQTLDLQRCLLRLPQEQRAVLLLVSVEDMSYEETARIVGAPVGTVMSRLSRARTRLRELMNSPAQVSASASASAATSTSAAPAAADSSRPVPALRRFK
jgi:RNA polymerase sigma-70 factor (ECF subfamily)